ncbi:MAG: peroxiredoxin [Myxococcota bacterium]|nr:peroxiredoxin [Myxococcota bacterium]
MHPMIHVLVRGAVTGCAVLGLLGCGRPAVRPDGGKGPIPVGAFAPEVAGYDAQAREVRLSAQRGHPTIVYFYPKDGTPGCTKEACAFRDVWARFETAHVTVIGVSSDSAEKHAEFLREKRLPFALASDPAGTVAASYGVATGFWGYDRVTFLVAGDGRVARYWADVDPGVHATEVLAVAETLK